MKKNIFKVGNLPLFIFYHFFCTITIFTHFSIIKSFLFIKENITCNITAFSKRRIVSYILNKVLKTIEMTDFFKILIIFFSFQWIC